MHFLIATRDAHALPGDDEANGTWVAVEAHERRAAWPRLCASSVALECKMQMGMFVRDARRVKSLFGFAAPTKMARIVAAMFGRGHFCVKTRIRERGKPSPSRLVGHFLPLLYGSFRFAFELADQI